MNNTKAKSFLEMAVIELLRDNDKDEIMAVVESICIEQGNHYGC